MFLPDAVASGRIFAAANGAIVNLEGSTGADSVAKRASFAAADYS